MNRQPYVTIARARTDFPSKFGVPRQAGLVPQLTTQIAFETEYRSLAAVRGLEGFSHLWLIWEFDKALNKRWQPTVRPPRLHGGRIGVFATRAPVRPRHLHNPDREFGLPFADLDVRFTFDGTRVIVRNIQPLSANAETAWPGYR